MRKHKAAYEHGCAYETETTISVAPAKIFKGFVLEADSIIPKIMPGAIKSSEILQGDGGPGTIKLITFGEGSPFKYVKRRTDLIDKDNFTYCYSVIEGDALSNRVEKISYELRFLPSSDGGSICKTISKYYTIGEIEIKEEQLKTGKAKAAGTLKAFEAYIVANPDAF